MSNKLIEKNNGPVANLRSKITSATLITAMATTVLLSGCASYSRDHFTVGSVPDDYRTRHPIIVSESEKSADIVISSGAHGLSYRDREVVRSMSVDFRNSGSQVIAIMVPTGSPNARAAGAAARDAVKTLKVSNIASNQIVVQHYNASHHGESATLRIVYADLNAAVDSKCGEWNEDLLDTKDNKNYQNFGCATQNNLANMIAHPADLLGPRGTDNIDATRRTNVINDWRTSGSGSYSF